MINARELALKILYEVEQNDAYSNLELNKQLSKYDIEQHERAFATEIVYGVIKWKLNIDHIISQFSKIKLNKISPWVINIIRIGIYQIKFLDKVPNSAAVNESVKLAKKYSNVGSVKFVNGLLRNYTRNIEKIIYPDKSNILEYLSVVYSHPKWLVQKWLGQFGAEFTQELLIANNEIPQINVRVNTLKCTKDELVNIFNNEGVESVDGLYFNDCLLIKSQKPISTLCSFKEGLFQIQDESSIMVGNIVNPIEGSFVIDVCAAPGGKSTHIAQLMNNKGKVISRDIHPHKIKLINDNCKRLGIDIIDTQVFDATNLDPNLLEKADYVIVDVPCSGLGIIRRKPDIKWNRNIEDNKSLVDLQRQILNTSAKYVNDNGVLVYSTCTIEREENIDIVNEFLLNNREFSLIDISDNVPNGLIGDTCVNGYIQTYPNIHNIDGFFVAKMTKKKNR